MFIRMYDVCMYVYVYDLLENSLATHSQHCKKVSMFRWYPSSRDLFKDTHLFPSQWMKNYNPLPNLGSFM